MPRRPLVQGCLEKCHQRIELSLIRVRRADGWHHLCSQLADDFLPDITLSGDICQVCRLQGQSGGLRPLAVTCHTVLVNQSAVFGR